MTTEIRDSQAVEIELDTHRTRRDEVLEQTATAQKELDTLQAAFATGARNETALTSESARVLALQGVIPHLEKQIEKLEIEYSNVRASEARSAAFVRAVEIAQEAEIAFADQQHHLVEAGRLLRFHAEKIIEAVTRRHAIRQEFVSVMLPYASDLNAYSETVPESVEAKQQQVFEELAAMGASLEALRVPFDGDRERALDRSHYQPPTIEFRGIVDMAVSAISREIAKAGRANDPGLAEWQAERKQHFESRKHASDTALGVKDFHEK